MATEATFTVPADQFPLGTVFEQLPDVEVELERIIPARDTVIPYFWVRGTAPDDVEAAFSDHPGVEDIRFIDSVEGDSLLRVEWSADYDDVLTTLTETNIALIKAVGTSQQWTFDIRGDSRQEVAAFQQRCRELDIPITLTKLHALTPIHSESNAMTDVQQATLRLAYEQGYFNSPRDVTMADLGDELGVTQQAVASRIRRGISAVLGQTLPGVESPD
jgi:predicted DNA binding protein